MLAAGLNLDEIPKSQTVSEAHYSETVLGVVTPFMTSTLLGQSQSLTVLQNEVARQ